MEVVDAVDLVVEVNGERHAVQAVIAHAATKAARMVRFAHRLKNLCREEFHETAGTIFVGLTSF